MTALILATLALILAILALVLAIKANREPIRLYFNTELTDRLDALEADLHLTKELVNADLVEHSKRLKRRSQDNSRDFRLINELDTRLTQLEKDNTR